MPIQIIPRTLPVAQIRDMPFFPHAENVLVFGRPRPINAIMAAWESDKLVFVALQKDPNILDPKNDELFTVGTICVIKHIFHAENGEVSILISGLYRAKVSFYENSNGFTMANTLPYEDTALPNDEDVQIGNHIISEFQNALRMGKSFDFLVVMRVMSGITPLELVDLVVPTLDIPPHVKQAFLEEQSLRLRLEKITDILSKEIKDLEVERSLAQKTASKLDKDYKERILHEKKRAIEEELGEEGDEASEAKELKMRLEKSGMPVDVRKKAEKELKKFEKMSNMNPEKGWARNYLEWLLDMPWDKSSPNNADIKRAEEILDEDHFGLAKAKERIVEHLAVLKLQHEEDSIDEIPLVEESSTPTNPPGASLAKKKRPVTPTILCFVGPPGVGKTSIGKSIAKALGREFVRVSLGGVRDEAEIRGHRRTYVGALPGRIIQGMKQAGTKNPVFMLDEIDKLGSDFRGDPSSALLEALDPEQNGEFTDHYLDVPFDLSQVFFITTANILDTIPSALLDRLEVIQFPGYTVEEKFNIAKKYLIPKQQEANGLKGKSITFEDSAVRTIITRYSYEAGVRNLEREIARIMRKIAKKITQGELATGINITNDDLHDYLGPFKFTSTIAERKDEAGLATGLFVSQAGGGILLVEVAIMPGKGLLTLTGRLGDVMQESARAAMSYVRSHWKELGIDQKVFSKIDVHIHVPEGAIPKDGPSAGTAITTALTSALTGRPVNRFVGMTGEVTLRGRVLEIGGVKEKVVGAHLAGIKKIILPKYNKKDLEEIPDYVTRDLEFIFVEQIDEVLKEALV
ncbi:MAG: endopeptidase La [bacterium]|nr:endopeptidase La [bacterium]